jgi:hypothetical protein
MLPSSISKHVLTEVAMSWNAATLLPKMRCAMRLYLQRRQRQAGVGQ